MEPLLICSRSTLLSSLFWYKLMRDHKISSAEIVQGCPCRSNLGKNLVAAGRSLAQFSIKRKNTFYHKRYATQKLSYPSCVRQRNGIYSCQFLFEVFPTNPLHPCTAINKCRNTIHYMKNHARVLPRFYTAMFQPHHNSFHFTLLLIKTAILCSSKFYDDQNCLYILSHNLCIPRKRELDSAFRWD